jgi:hypothetical protein
MILDAWPVPVALRHRWQWQWKKRNTLAVIV